MKAQQNKSQGNFGNEHEPFKGGYQKFAAISKQQRSQYNKKVLQAKQDPNPPPYNFKKDYPSSGTLTYQEYKLHYYCRQNSQSPKAILIHFHGMNGHGGGSGYFASVIGDKNKQLNIYALDQLNFGKSEGPFRGQIASLDDSVQQGQLFVEFLLKKFKTKPKIFLCGSSYGGCIIFKMTLKNPELYAGVIFLAPAIRNLAQSQPFMKKLGKALGCLLPRIRTFAQTYQSGTKHNMAKQIAADPLIYSDGVVPGSVRTVLNSMDEISELYKQLKTPYILFQSGMDKIVDLFAPLDLQQLSPSPDKTTIYCENMWHAVFAEEQIQGISWKVGEWLKKRI